MANGLATALLRTAGIAVVVDKEELLDTTDTDTTAGYRKELMMQEEVSQDTIHEDHLEEEIDDNRGRTVIPREILDHPDILRNPQMGLDMRYHLDLM